MASFLRSAASSSSSLLRTFSTSIRRSQRTDWSANPAASAFVVPETGITELFQNLELPPAPSTASSTASSASDQWWRQRSDNAKIDPGNQYSGRSLIVTAKGNRGFARQYRQLGGVLARSNIRKELKIAEFYEKPSNRRRRVESERHRRRFQELVSAFMVGR